jgi:hypothetical protein
VATAQRSDVAEASERAGPLSDRFAPMPSGSCASELAPPGSPYRAASSAAGQFSAESSILAPVFNPSHGYPRIWYRPSHSPRPA